MSLSTSRQRHLLSTRQLQECPPCFNCQLSTDKCTNGGLCDPSGVCQCISGWGDTDCSKPLCGSLYSEDRPIRQGDHCDCDDGWGGVNCNVCQSDQACIPAKGANATCSKTAIGIKSMHAWCDTTNIPWIDNTHVSLQCDWEQSQCVFQFWKDSQEQFYCELSDCTQTTTDGVEVHGKCENAVCGCMENAFMCGGEVDMSKLVANVKGPSEWYCKDGQNCWYNEYSTLVGIFPDNIMLSCDVGECLNDQDLADVAPIVGVTESLIAFVVILVGIIVYAATKLAVKRQQRMFGGSIQLSDIYESEQDAQNQDDEIESEEALLTFDNVTYTVGGKRILSKVRGYVEPGQILAIMGPSGAGKSSLLDILARKPKRGIVSGDILINNVYPSKKRIKKITGFVDQDDTLMATLTVRETLMYAATLRLPRNMPIQQKQKRVAQVIQELGLERIADMAIGSPGHRGISGGEKRRVSIGKELVTGPSLLFLDEPTSGLDAYNAAMVMECLKRLAKHKRHTIVVTIHQPRTNIYNMFDSLMLLAYGNTVYFGPASQTSRYFRDIGFPIPAGYNVADYLIDLTIKRPDDTTTDRDGTTHSRSSSSSTDTIQQHQLDDEPCNNENEESLLHISDVIRDMNTGEPHNSMEFSLLSEANHTYHLVQSFKSSRFAEALDERIRKPHAHYPKQQPGNDSSFSMIQFMHELKILSSRTFINLYRDPSLFFAHITCSTLLGVLLGTLFWQVDVDLSGVQNRLGVLFFMCALLGFASTSALSMFNRERLIFMRERENGYYSASSYFIAKLLFDLIPLRVFPPLLMGSTSYYMIGLNPTGTVFGKFLLVLVLFNLSAVGLCLCFATAIKNLASANLFSNLVMLFSMLFGGFLLNKDHIPSFLSWLKYLSFFNYGYEALIVNELKDLTLRDDTIADIKIPGSIILTRFGFDSQAFWIDIVRLSLFVTITLTIAFLLLKFFVIEQR
ncbi:hypothetical protein O0I10_007779 [Lichtheimia ornata]|uniref:ABC transporter domain-containing protein n=1 Tax=Lichtheimia ornata TaxID=688661 RepID=A0AAD7V2F2_9FUNG|nr:uncharacterized protein O0I10_007779 [Lichtheimia ornata]KAJ8656456.1 hypothetical protein O0I10_007779 [Lichtheimia ornata]